MKASTSTRAKKAPARSAPHGLRRLFDAMQPAGLRAVHGWTYPDNFLEVLDAIDITDQEGGGDAFLAALRQAADRELGNVGYGPNGELQASECADVIAVTSFWAGVAACWQVMTAITGKDGVR